MLYELVACLSLLGQVWTQSRMGRVQQALYAGQSIGEILSSADAFYHLDNEKTHEWNYDNSSDIGPPRWGDHFPHCNPLFRPPPNDSDKVHITRQSPINIESAALNYAPFSAWWNYPEDDPYLTGEISISHKAPSFQVDCDDDDNDWDNGNDNGNGNGNGNGYEKYIFGRDEDDDDDTCEKYELKMRGVGRLLNRSDDTFIFEKFHFHFTKHDKGGSEHSVNGLKADSEMHVVHYNKKYGSYENAQDKRDGLAVVAFFLMVGDDDQRNSQIMNHILSKFDRLIEEKKYKAILRADLLTGSELFYMYEGSTTTPSCHEHVIWFIRRLPISIKREHLEMLRKLRYHDYNEGELIIKHGNVRPIQRHYVPHVYYN